MAKVSSRKTRTAAPSSHAASRLKAVAQSDTGVAALAVGLFEKTTQIPASLQAADAAVGGAIGQALKLGDFKGKAGSVTTLPATGNAQRVMLVGLGKREPFDLDTLRWAAGAVAKAAKSLKLANVALQLHTELPATLAAENVGQALAEGVVLGGFTYTEFKKKDDADAASQAGTQFQVIEPDAARREALQRGLVVGEAIALATNYARRIACKPGNVLNPKTLVEEAKSLAQRTGLKLKIISAAEAEKLGMGGLVSVGKGSEYPSALILLEHAPKAAAGKTVAVVGKAVTFDTGGISIKPAADMDAMKYDKCGGMAVLGILQAAAELNLPVRVIGAIPTAENSVSAAAYRPGDILRMYNGKTVEITNTDAEGRLILADALAYVAEKYQPDAMIDMATLTGGVIVALGSVYAGLLSNHDGLSADLEKAGQASGEWVWRLPLHERYKPLMDGTHADLQNSGGREAHPVQGAIFLQHFVPEKMPWAHLDIAGTAHPKKEDRYFVKGANGFGVRLVVEYLRAVAKR